jgi:putative isomerase
VSFVGSRFEVGYLVDGEGALNLSLKVLQTPEWGLRFWYCFQVGMLDESPFFGIERDDLDPYRRSPVYELEGQKGHRYSVTVSERCVDSVGHARFDEISEAFLHAGYYQRVAPSLSPAVVTLRFNAMTEQVTLRLTPRGPARESDPLETASLSPQRSAITDGERSANSDEIESTDESESTDPEEFPLHFARRVGRTALGWGKVWDRTHDRVIVASSRRWIDERFGGWNIWQCDGWIHLIMAARAGEESLALEILDSMSLLLTDRPHAAALMSGTTQWVDRNHPPYGALALWEYVSAFSMTPLVVSWVHQLVREFRWWFVARDGNNNGLVEYGSDPVGDGHFVHTLQGAMDEAAMDNAAVWDDASFDLTTHTMDVEDVGLNSLLILQGELLLELLEMCSEDPDGDQADLRARVDSLRTLVRDNLWDEQRQIFAARLWSGRFVDGLAPTSFYPLAAACASTEQVDALLGHLANEKTFGGGPLVPGSDRGSSAASDNTYWRGRIWTPYNYLVYLGLRRVGAARWATELAISSYRHIAQAQLQGLCPENFSQSSWEIDVDHDCEPQYTWGAMMAYLSSMEAAMVTPWRGVELGIDEETYHRWNVESQPEGGGFVGEIQHLGHCFGVRVHERSMEVTHDGVVVLHSDRPVRLHRLVISEDTVTGVCESSKRTLLRSVAQTCEVGVVDGPEEFVLRR